MQNYFTLFEMSRLNSFQSLVIICTLIVILIPSSLASSSKYNVVYKCCAIQKTFGGSRCNSVEQDQASSEFDINFHQDVWSIPVTFRNEEVSGRDNLFNLSLESHPIKGQMCEKSRFHFDNFPKEFSEYTQEPSENDSSLHTTSLPPTPPTFNANGTLFYQSQLYAPDSFCIDSLSQQGDYTSVDIILLLSKCGAKQVSSLFLPSSIHCRHEEWIKHVFAGVAALSSLFALSITAIYLKLRNYLNVSGWTEFGYFIALVLFNILSMPDLVMDYNELSQSAYIGFSASLHFVEIMTFSSFFLISLDLYWMLRRSDSYASYGEYAEDISKVRLALYYVVVLSVPIGLTTYGVIQHHELSADVLESCHTPAWQWSEYILFGLESLSLIFILLSLSHVLGRLSKNAEVDDAPRVSLLSNLFYFSISYWILDLLKFARPMFFGQGQHDVKIEYQVFWIILDGMSYAQGVWVFIVFAFNRKTLRAFKIKSGRDATLKEIFRHACCSAGSRGEQPSEDEMPMSPLMQSMKSSSMRRSTVRHNHLY